MAPQYSLPTRLSDYIAFLLPWAHGHQLKAIGDFVAAIIEQQTACQAQLARYLASKKPRSNAYHACCIMSGLSRDSWRMPCCDRPCISYPSTARCDWPLTGPLKRTSMCWWSPSWEAVALYRFTGAPLMPQC